MAAALMSRMHIERKDRPKVKIACLRLLGRQRLDRARSMLVSHFVDQYLWLDPDERISFHEEVKSLPTEETETVYDMMTSWEKEGLAKGLEQGLAQGRREAMIDILEVRFGQLPQSVKARLNEVTELDRLRELGRLAATADSLADFEAHL